MADASDDLPTALRAFRAACFVVTGVAAVAGAVMVVAPDATDRYFSWPIGPPPLAALVGAFYLASALTFAILGVRSDWRLSRGIAFGILAFTLPTVVATVHHHDLFDWSRWQALAWVALFVGSPMAFASFLFLLRGRARTARRGLPAARRAAIAILGVAYAALAVGFLLTPHRLERVSPFALPGLSGRFLGSWCAFLAVVAAFVAVRNRSEESHVALLALVIWPVAAIAAAVRSLHDLQPTSRRVPYLVGLVVLAVLAAVAYAGRGRDISAARAE